MAQRLKRLPAIQETWVRSLGQKNPLEKGMATHSSVLVWRIPWMEEPDGLQSTGSQRVGHDWATALSLSLSLLTMQEDGSPKRHNFDFYVHEKQLKLYIHLQNKDSSADKSATLTLAFWLSMFWDNNTFPVWTQELLDKNISILMDRWVRNSMQM